MTKVTTEITEKEHAEIRIKAIRSGKKLKDYLAELIREDLRKK